MLVDDQPSEKYDGISKTGVVFSSDGNHVAYAAQRSKKWFVVLDGQQGAEYDLVAPRGPTFRPDGALEYLVTKEHVIYRVQYAPMR